MGGQQLKMADMGVARPLLARLACCKRSPCLVVYMGCFICCVVALCNPLWWVWWACTQIGNLACITV